MDTITQAQEQKQKRLRKELNERILGYMLGAFGLVAGLAWNDAIQTFIAYVYPQPENTLSAKFLYALITTCVVVVVSVYLSRLFNRLNGSAQ